MGEALTQPLHKKRGSVIFAPVLPSLPVLHTFRIPAYRPCSGVIALVRRYRLCGISLICKGNESHTYSVHTIPHTIPAQSGGAAAWRSPPVHPSVRPVNRPDPTPLPTPKWDSGGYLYTRCAAWISKKRGLLMPKLTKSPIDLDAIDVKELRKPGSKSTALDLEKVLTMRQRGLSLNEIGKIVGVSKQAVSQYLKRQGVDIEEIDHFRKNKAVILHGKQKMILDQIDNAQIKKMSPSDKVISFGILYDKAKIEEGKGFGAGQGLWINIVQASHASDTVKTAITVDATPATDEVSE